jgi:uncharacterized metal-binding protein YceD (DUF177 family)
MGSIPDQRNALGNRALHQPVLIRYTATFSPFPQRDSPTVVSLGYDGGWLLIFLQYPPMSAMDTLNLKQFLQFGPDRLSLESQYTFPDIPAQGAFHCMVNVQKRATGVDVSGTISGDAELTCDRCMAPMIPPINIPFDERFVFSHYVDHEAREAERLVDEFYEEIDAEGSLDLKDLIRQLLLLDLSQPHLCGREDCHLDDGFARLT